MAETKYGHLVKKLGFRKGTMGGANARQLISMSGDELEGLNLNFTMGLYKETGQCYPGKGARIHPYDECLIFFGHNVDDLSYLGTELTLEIGNEREKHTFDVPTAVAIPKGLPHLTMVCNRTDRPYRVMQVGLGAKYESSWID